MEKIIGIIPARYASTRFPGKPLVDIRGKTMIQRVYEQVKKAEILWKVIVATDDKRILDTVIAFGGEAQMTSVHHQSGTDRCAEVATQFNDLAAIINIQGDEPFIDPEQINTLANCFINPDVQIASLYKKISKNSDLFNPNIPKIAMNPIGEALYFSRSPIPFLRGLEQQKWINEKNHYQHVGIYGYRSDILKQITQLAPSPLEMAESLEQLRWLENGYKIVLKETESPTYPVDSPEDLERILHFLDTTD